ncbi:hypothetical protein [Bdellovibrio sp. HCB288]|uniref:hypothetical protein n=1 Tax=Bdellovibrio sp. HCB288 TaxID=3394355 RepID=UPI0039B38980
MVRFLIVQIMIVVSLFNFWSVGFAAQLDDCCETEVQHALTGFEAESVNNQGSVSENHQDDECATRCAECVICQSQCNQHGLLSFSSQMLEIEFQQVHGEINYLAYPEAEIRVLKEPPRV